MPDLVMPKVEGLDKKKYPGLKVPSPAFNVQRMRDKKPTGILSRIDRSSRVGVDQVLLNELNKPADKPHAFAIIKMGKGRQFAGIGAIPRDIVEGLDEFTLREFQRVRSFWYFPFSLVRAFDPAVPMRSPAPGRRFAGEVDIPSGDAATAAKVDDPPTPFVDDDGRVRAVTKFDRLESPADRFVAVTPGEGTPWRVSNIEARDEVAACMEAGELAADRGLSVVHFAQQVGIAKDRPVFEIEGVVAAMDDVAAARQAVELADPVRLKEATPDEVRLVLDTLRRFHQLHFEGKDITVVEDLSREDIINAFIFAVQEARRRGIPVAPKREIDSEAMDLDPELFKAHRKCRFCSESATKIIVWADGRGKILVCVAHVDRAKQAIADQDDKVSSIRDLDKADDVEKIGSDPATIARVIRDAKASALADLKAMPVHEMMEALERFHRKHFDGNDEKNAEDVSRAGLLGAFRATVADLIRRGANLKPNNPLAREALRRWPTLFQKSESDRDDLRIEGREFAPTYPSGEKSGRRIHLEEVLDKIKRFQFRKDAIVIVGGLANHGFTDNDIDVLIKGPIDESTEHVLKFRIGRMLGPELSRRVQFLSADEYGGPFTDHVVIGHLCVDMPGEFTVKEMRDPTAKQDDPLLDLPAKKGKLQSVVQLHFRGRTVHADFRILVADHLVGWTLPMQRAGVIKEPVTTLAEARRIARGYDVAEGNRFLKPMLAPAGIRARAKARQPKKWLDLGDSVFEEGEVGATRNFPGVLLEIDRPKIEFGRQESRFHEYFVTDSKLWNGIWFSRLLVGRGGEPEEEVEAGRATREGETFWKFSISKKFLPSILKPRTVRRGDMPPAGVSWIPVSLERDVPAPFRYWEKKGAEAKRTRDKLVEEDVIDEKSVRIVDGDFRKVVSKQFVENDGAFAEVEKALRQPWFQYGGAGRYARWLANRLPDHKVYVEPFAGAGAVLFAKEPAEKEVIADIDPEIVFAFKFLKNLTKEKLEALKRFDWVNTQAGYDRARKMKPASPPERFWRHVYGRFCAWSGVPSFHGRKTDTTGKRYGLEGLWKLHERLKNVTILCQDWRETVKQFDGPNTLFFIDPPYVGEWDQNQKDREIAPDLVAAALRKVKGDFVIAYTDHPRVRREFEKIGHGRRIGLPEAHPSGTKAGSRFFSSSFRIAKSIDAALVEKQPTRVRYTLARQSFRGPIQIRAGFSKVFWWLVLDRPGRADVRAWRLLIDPTSGESEIAAVKAQPEESRDKALLELSGHQEPGTRFNPTKDTPSDVAVVGRGRVELLDDREGFLRLRFLSGPIKGSRSLAAEEPGSDLWEYTRGAGPGRAAKFDPIDKAVPMRDDVQIWNPDQKDPDADRSELRPLAIFAPMKPRKGWLDPSEFLREWPTPEMIKSGIDVEPKYNGLRAEPEVDGRGRTLIFFEDAKDDRSEILPGLAAELQAIAKKVGPFILDAELIDHDEDGNPLPRRTLSRFTGPVKPQDDANVRLHVFRLIFGLGKNWAAVPRLEARPALQEFFRRIGKTKHLVLAPARRARSIEALPELIKWASNVPGSEGAMFKLSEATYSLGGFSSSWAKLKIPRTIRAIVVEKIPKEPGPEQRSPARTFVYRAAIGPISEKSVDRWDGVSKIGNRSYIEIGRTFATNVQAKVGDVLEVKATELLIDQTREKHTVRWFTPVVVGKIDKRPHTPDEIIALAFEHEIKRAVEKFLDREVPIYKADNSSDEERIAYGIVLEPETCDSQKEIYSAEEIRTAAHQYMEHFRHAGLMHQTRIDGRVRILESFIAPVDFEIEGVRVKRGTWLMAMRIVDDKLWEAVKDKRLTGFSIGGSAVREPTAA